MWLNKSFFCAKSFLICGSFLLLSTSLQGHDFWLEAHPFYTTPGNRVEISAHAGTQFIGDSQPNIVNMYTDFSRWENGKRKEVDGELGRDPAGYFKPRYSGTYAIGYQSIFNYIEIEAETFNQYLTDEGLNAASNLRERLGEHNLTGKEEFRRHVKTLIQIGEPGDIDQTHTDFGYDLELHAEQNPYQLKVGDTLTVSLHYLGKPIDNILIQAQSKKHPESVQKQRSSKTGKAAFLINEPGPWLIKAVKINRVDPEQDSTVKGDWQSHWASLTFMLRN